MTEEPVKSLGNWYSLPLTDRHRGGEIQERVEAGLKAIDGCGLPGKFKAWCFQFDPLPRILWPLQMYEVTMTKVEAMERKVSSHIKRWLGVPRTLTNVAFYSSTAKLQMPTTSLVEEFKAAKSCVYLMLRYSTDPVIRDTQPEVPCGRKWKVTSMTLNNV